MTCELASSDSFVIDYPQVLPDALSNRVKCELSGKPKPAFIYINLFFKVANSDHRIKPLWFPKWVFDLSHFKGKLTFESDLNFAEMML